jgi:heme A synthase
MIPTNILLGLHVLNAIGLVVGAFMTIGMANKVSSELGRLAKVAAGLISITFIAGVLTVYTHSNWWSFAMALGFIASLLLYVKLWVRARA